MTNDNHQVIGNTKICYQSRVYFNSIGTLMIYTETELALEKNAD